MLTKEETLALLGQAGIAYQIAEHEAVFTVEAVRRAGIPFQHAGAKNLFLRDDKRRNYYLVSLPDDKARSLKEIQARLGSRRLSFASEEELGRMLGVIPGAVTPLAALNDRDHAVQVVLDQAFVDGGEISVHPCDNTATVLLATSDLIALLRSHGAPVSVVAF